MFRLGIYDEDEARAIAGHLKDAGIKVDLKPFMNGHLEAQNVLEGRMSEIKGELKDPEIYEEFNRYLNALKEVLPGASDHEGLLEDMSLKLDPALNEKRAEIQGLLEADPEAQISDEEREAQEKRFSVLMNDMAKIANAEVFADTLLKRNKIELGSEAGSHLDDPIVRIPVNLDDYGGEHRLARSTVILTLVPMMEVNIDEFSTALTEDLDEDFREEYPNESLMITGLSALIVKLAEQPSPAKMEMEDFAQICEVAIEDDGNIVQVDGYDAADELAKALEKNGVIKRKGDLIKWRR